MGAFDAAKHSAYGFFPCSKALPVPFRRVLAAPETHHRRVIKAVALGGHLLPTTHLLRVAAYFVCGVTAAFVRKKNVAVTSILAAKPLLNSDVFTAPHATISEVRVDCAAPGFKGD